jgi:hypothetical protein
MSVRATPVNRQIGMTMKIKFDPSIVLASLQSAALQAAAHCFLPAPGGLHTAWRLERERARRRPPPLLPTIAIEVAPPAVAGNSWFAINGGRVDIPAAVLAGFTVLMLVVQLRLIPLYRQAPFGPGFWAFSFPFAAAVTYGVHWLAAEHVRGGTALGYALVGVLTAGFALLAARTVTGLINGTFLPRVAVTGQAGAAPAGSRSSAG